MRLQCNVCGSKSANVDQPEHPTLTERQMLDEFVLLHNFTCAKLDTINFPIGAVSQETLNVPNVGPFGAPKPPPVSVRKPHGHWERTGPYGEQQNGDTLSCCHCRKHWEVRVGSGRIRGYCQNCMGYTCGGVECDICIPYEQRLWNIEHGLPPLTPAAPQVLVPPLPRGLLLPLRERVNDAERNAGCNTTIPPNEGKDSQLGMAPSGPRRDGARAGKSAIAIGTTNSVSG